MRPKLTKRTAVVVTIGLLLIIGVCLSVFREQYAVVPVLVTKWHRGGSLYVRNTNDGTSDLLMISLGIESTYAMDDWPKIPTSILVEGQPVYRYVAADLKLVEVSPATWDISTGKISDFVSQGPSLTNSGTFTRDLLTRRIQFNDKVVPTAGPTVLNAQPDPTETYVAVLSAEGKFRKSWIPFGDPTVRGDRYHQLFRMSDATEVGKPVKLKVATNGPYVMTCWSADGRYVVYQELDERLWIIDVSAVLADAKPE